MLLIDFFTLNSNLDEYQSAKRTSNVLLEFEFRLAATLLIVALDIQSVKEKIFQMAWYPDFKGKINWLSSKKWSKEKRE